MFREEFQLGGPVMYAVLGVWVIMLSLILERLLFWLGRLLTRTKAPEGGAAAWDALAADLEDRAERNCARIDGLSHLATSLGLFGTVLGIAQAFFARGTELALAAPEVLASGMATALFTTVAGLSVFLVGQGFLLVFAWWRDAALRRLRARAAGAVG